MFENAFSLLTLTVIEPNRKKLRNNWSLDILQPEMTINCTRNRSAPGREFCFRNMQKQIMCKYFFLTHLQTSEEKDIV